MVERTNRIASGVVGVLDAMTNAVLEGDDGRDGFTSRADQSDNMCLTWSRGATIWKQGCQRVEQAGLRDGHYSANVRSI